MSGIYGNDPEDQYFQDKLLNREGENEMGENEEKYTELDQEVIDKITSYMDDNDIDSDIFNILDDIVLPILSTLERKNIVNNRHLRQHLDELEVLEEKMEELQQYTEDLEHINTKIYEIARKI